MRKKKISVTIDEDTIGLVETLLENKNFRNRSHVFEIALNKFLEEEDDKKN